MPTASQVKPAPTAARDTAKLNLALLAASLLFSLLIAEVISRIYLYGPLVLLPSYGNSIHAIGLSGHIKPSTYLRIRWELKPGLNTIYKMVPFRTNSQGLADKEYSVQKPPNTYRVAVLGDSWTMPEGTALEGAWHTLLEDDYNRNSKGKSYEFINFGVDGYNLDQELATLEYRALKFSPDHVILGFCVENDIPKIGARKLPFHYTVKRTEHPYFHWITGKLIVKAWNTTVAPMLNKSSQNSEEDLGKSDRKALKENLLH